MINVYFNDFQNFRSAALTDSTASGIKESIPHVINGLSLLAATAPALAGLMLEAGSIINFDRCCHLVYENADSLIREHPSSMKQIYGMYHKSVKRTESQANSGISVPRQVIDVQFKHSHRIEAE